MQLLNKSTGQTLIPQLLLADTRATRNKGLLGRSDLAPTEALLIKRCRWVHTFFMRFAIDLIYVNREMKVRKTVSNMRPYRLGLPVLSACDVIELKAGFLERHPVKIGDELYVDHTLS